MPSLGVIISLVVVFGGLLWFLVQSLKGREVGRRVIFLFIAVSVASPILFNMTFEEHATPVVKAFFSRVDNLPAGSNVLISFDFDPAMAPEVQPMADAISRHCLDRGHKVIFMSLWATGQSLMTTTLTNVIFPEFPEKVDGIDYVNIGYKAGNEGVLNVIVTDFKKMFPADANGVQLDSIEIFDDVRSCADLDMIIALGGGRPGPKEWVLFVGDPADVQVAAGVAAVVAPQLYPYYPQQLFGILGGVKGAAEYEQQLKEAHPRFADMTTPGLQMMGPQTLAHIVIMAFIVIGNIAYFRSRKKVDS